MGASPWILASASPRRRELLESFGVTFTVEPASIDETPRPGEAAHALVGRLAREKARAVASHHPDSLVIAADTVIVVDGEILGKPADSADARATLRRLSGRSHDVLTGVAAIDRRADFTREFVERSEVVFDTLDDATIDAYVATGEPLDKAGSYAIQGEAARFASVRSGSRSNVIGLPVERLALELAAHPTLRDESAGPSAEDR